MLYNDQYIKDSVEVFAKMFETDYEKASYDIEVDGIFRDPPVVEIVRFLEKSGEADYQDRMIRHCILDRSVTIILDGERIGTIRLNNLTDAWEVFPVFAEHPMAYLALNNVVMSYIGKKCTLPRKKSSKVEAGTATTR